MTTSFERPGKQGATPSRTSPVPIASRSSRTRRTRTSSTNEVYENVAAFNAHAGGPYFGAFFAEAGTYAEGPTWLMKGNVIGDQAAA